VATRATVDSFASANRDIRSLVQRELRALWAALPGSPEAATVALVEFLPSLISAYGDVAATVAAEFYEQMRTEANISGRFTPRLAPSPAAEAVQINARWAAGPLYRDAPLEALARLDHIVDRMSLQAGRDTIDANVRTDPASPRWARVPTGAETCAFCLTMASRGPVYGSKRSAGGDHNHFHAACDCTPTPIWPGDALPEGYDPDALYQSYLAARDKAGSGGTKSILSELRKLEGSH
jgi:hypothetical protein